jgi:limonene-1,2-epoxide hydrolase
MPATPDDLVRDFIAAVERLDLDHALTMLSDDCRYDNVPIGEVVGTDAVRSTLGPFLNGYDEVQWVVHHQAALGTLREGVVLNERIDRFRKGDEWHELPVAGVFEVHAGLITLWRDYFDRDTLFRLLDGSIT